MVILGLDFKDINANKEKKKNILLFLSLNQKWGINNSKKHLHVKFQSYFGGERFVAIITSHYLSIAGGSTLSFTRSLYDKIIKYLMENFENNLNNN